MDLGSALIGAIAIILCAIPFIVMIRDRKRKEKALHQALVEDAKQYNCEISQYETFGNFAIGLDENKAVVFYHHQSKAQGLGIPIYLKEMASCIVVKKYRNISDSEGYKKVLDRLELLFTPKLKSAAEIRLQFYNAEESAHLNEELLASEKWAALINAQIKPAMKKAA
ncbi:MAG: hypothetical protein ACPF8V_06985 [Luteibaculum sp.]